MTPAHATTNTVPLQELRVRYVVCIFFFKPFSAVIEPVPHHHPLNKIVSLRPRVSSKRRKTGPADCGARERIRPNSSRMLSYFRYLAFVTTMPKKLVCECLFHSKYLRNFIMVTPFAYLISLFLFKDLFCNFQFSMFKQKNKNKKKL